MNEWKDIRPFLCRMGLHKWFRDEVRERHCLRCSEQQHFIAGIGVADWSATHRPYESVVQ